jgi:hypothetical protein
LTANLVEALLFVADDLDRRAYPFAGAVRQGARRITELEATPPVRTRAYAARQSIRNPLVVVVGTARRGAEKEPEMQPFSEV